MKKIKLFEEFVKESLKSANPNEVITIELDMAWDHLNKDDDKAAKAAFKKYKIKVEPVGHADAAGLFNVTGKKKDILAYLQSEFYEMDDETIEEYYPELLESVVNEAKDFTQMALEILGDISQEFDPWEIRDMLPKDAEDTVDAYYPKWNSADKKKLAKELMNYADQPDQWITEAVVSEVFKYTEDDINMQYGFYGTLDNHFDNEKKVQKMYLTAISDLMKSYKVSEETAIKILDSREGRHFADFIIDGMVKNVVDAVAKFFGSGARVFNFINSVSEGREYNEANVVLDGGWVDTKELDWVDHTRVVKWIHNELDDKATMTRDGKFWSIDTSKLLPKQVRNLIEYLRSQRLLKEEHSVTEAKTMDRDDMMIHLEDKYKFRTVRPSEDFDGAQGGIWVSGENGESLGGKRIYDYYASGAAYELGVLKKYEQAINKLGWYSEWYDAGTVMIWPI